MYLRLSPKEYMSPDSVSATECSRPAAILITRFPHSSRTLWGLLWLSDAILEVDETTKGVQTGVHGYVMGILRLGHVSDGMHDITRHSKTEGCVRQLVSMAI